MDLDEELQGCPRAQSVGEPQTMREMGMLCLISEIPKVGRKMHAWTHYSFLRISSSKTLHERIPELSNIGVLQWSVLMDTMAFSSDIDDLPKHLGNGQRSSWPFHC